MHFIKIKSRTVVGRKNSVCGTSTDGPYQAYEFGFTIQEETGRHRIPEELRFCQAVIWDATHLLNLAATDIKEESLEKVKNSLPILSREQMTSIT
jgi:hypothetical protein